MLRKLTIFVLSLTLVLPYLSFGTPKAHALGNVVTISKNTSADALFPSLTADNKGYLHVAWQEYDGNAVNPGIFYSRWNGDTWSDPLEISENTAFAENVAVTTDSSRTTHFVWNDDSYTGLPQAVYRTRTEAGVLSSIESIPLPAGTISSRLPDIAIDGSNNPNAVFAATPGTGHSIYWSTRTGGSWSTPTLVSTNVAGDTLNHSQFSQLKVDLSGNLHLVYWDTAQGIFYRKYSGGNWSTPVLMAAGNVQYVRMAVTPSGEVFVTWRSINDTSIKVRWTISGNWQTATSLTTTSSNSSWGLPIMGVTTDSANRAHVGWGERDGGGLIDLKYRSYAGGTWQAAQDVDLDNNDADSPFVFPDLWDNQHFAWAELNSTTGKWEILYRVAEGTIQTVPTSGGTVTANPFGTNQAALTIPSGALSLSTQIGIQVGPVPANVNPNVVTIPKAYTFRPHGLNFNTPATARIYYTSAEAGAADETQLQPWLWDSQTNTYTAQTVTKRNTTQNWMEVDLTHFSLYGIAAPRLGIDWKKPTDKLVKGKNLDYEFQFKGSDGKIASVDVNDLKVVLKDSSNNILLTHTNTKDGVGEHGKDGFKGSFKSIKELSGTYTLEVYIAGDLAGSRSVELK